MQRSFTELFQNTVRLEFTDKEYYFSEKQYPQLKNNVGLNQTLN